MQGSKLMKCVANIHPKHGPGLAAHDRPSLTSALAGTQGRNPHMKDAPQVAKDVYACLKWGNLCAISDLVPINPSLVLHHINEKRWQVRHHVDSRFSETQHIRAWGLTGLCAA